MRLHPLGSSLLLSCTLVLGALACGSGSATEPGGVGSVRSEAEVCAARESRITTCAADASSSIVFSRSSCEKKYRCTTAIYAAPGVYFDCWTSPDCAAESGDERCSTRAGEGRTRPEGDRCAKRYAECQAAGGRGFNNDLCPAMKWLRDDVVSKLAACIERPCGEVSDCADATVVALAPDCD